MLKKIILISEDGKEEISLNTAIALSLEVEDTDEYLADLKSAFLGGKNRIIVFAHYGNCDDNIAAMKFIF